MNRGRRLGLFMAGQTGTVISTSLATHSPANPGWVLLLIASGAASAWAFASNGSRP